jgi:hypothetical protein
MQMQMQIAESLKQLEKGSPLGGDDDPTILSRNQVFNLEDSVSVRGQPQNIRRKSTQRTVTLSCCVSMVQF